MCALAGARIEGDLLQTWTATSLFERLWYLPNIQMTGLRVSLMHECADTTLPTSSPLLPPFFPLSPSFPAPLPLPLRGRRVSYADRLLKPGQKGANCERNIFCQSYICLYQSGTLFLTGLLCPCRSQTSFHDQRSLEQTPIEYIAA